MAEDSRDPATVRGDTALRPEFVGIGVIGGMAYIIGCVIFLIVPVVGGLFAGVEPAIVVALGVVICLVEIGVGVGLAAVSSAAPNQHTTGEFVRHLLTRRYGQQTVRHDDVGARHYSALESFANHDTTDPADTDDNE